MMHSIVGCEKLYDDLSSYLFRWLHGDCRSVFQKNWMPRLGSTCMNVLVVLQAFSLGKMSSYFIECDFV